MEKYVPDIYQKDIYTINYETLLSRGVKCLLFDLDNTIAPITESEPSNELTTLFDDLKKHDFKLIIFSNSPKFRVNKFQKLLKVDAVSSARKPSSKSFLAVIKKYQLAFSEVAIIGDSVMDDIAGGNNVGITTVLVDPISKKEFPLARIRRIIEKKKLKKLRKLDLFTKGRYYE